MGCQVQGRRKTPLLPTGWGQTGDGLPIQKYWPFQGFVPDLTKDLTPFDPGLLKLTGKEQKCFCLPLA